MAAPAPDRGALGAPGRRRRGQRSGPMRSPPVIDEVAERGREVSAVRAVVLDPERRGLEANGRSPGSIEIGGVD